MGLEDNRSFYPYYVQKFNILTLHFWVVQEFIPYSSSQGLSHKLRLGIFLGFVLLMAGFATGHGQQLLNPICEVMRRTPVVTTATHHCFIACLLIISAYFYFPQNSEFSEACT